MTNLINEIKEKMDNLQDELDKLELILALSNYLKDEDDYYAKS